ncbi:LysR family transcriptional regulator [Psychromonas sp. Urea-02u-13]|uniref:LysR family transcriptional regulator n=1 Tax=Psychromonas sp. Urea-02u-13 TaxID=2058326 RepID=UPI000C3420CB|nr:LysR family transcriptional regulator [Psychromonas sp. Urea-02u-13]PKG38499.1 hypothetical protein CXF74_13470 [Psychromonas sp. Urea-02u-13]
MVALARFLPTFIQASETLNFSQTAREMGITPAAVSKNIKALETELGLRLFHRTTHALSLTNDGQHFYQQVEPLVNQLNAILVNTHNLQQVATGTLKVSMPYEFGRLHLLPLLKGFKTQYPQINLDLRFEDKLVNLVDDSIDIAIGNIDQQDSGIIARQLCPLDLVVVASPLFIKENGTPTHPAQLKNATCINYRNPNTERHIAWPFIDENGDNFSIKCAANISVTNIEICAQLALQGLGFTMISRSLVLNYLATGELISLLEQYQSETPAIMLYYASKAQQPAKVRVFIDYILANFTLSSIP